MTGTLQEKLDAAIQADFLASMSDNFYHTSGRFESAQRYIRELKRQIIEEEEEQIKQDNGQFGVGA